MHSQHFTGRRILFIGQPDVGDYPLDKMKKALKRLAATIVEEESDRVQVFVFCDSHFDEPENRSAVADYQTKYPKALVIEYADLEDYASDVHQINNLSDLF